MNAACVRRDSTWGCCDTGSACPQSPILFLANIISPHSAASSSVFGIVSQSVFSGSIAILGSLPRPPGEFHAPLGLCGGGDRGGDLYGNAAGSTGYCTGADGLSVVPM